jgi:hypothetical protein
MNFKKKVENLCSAWRTRSISAVAILSTVQAVMAEAVTVRSVSAPAIDSSPNKSPAASSVTVASLPPLEMTVSFARPV